MPRYLLFGGDVFIRGERHRNGSVIEFEGEPSPGMSPLDTEATRAKLASMPAVLAASDRYPQRVILLAKSLDGAPRCVASARVHIERWVAEQAVTETQHADHR